MNHLEHHPISILKPNQVPGIDTSVIATSTSEPLSKILQEVLIRCNKRTTQLPTIQINSFHSKTLGLSNIQRKDFKKKRKKDFKMSNLSQEQAQTSSLGQNARVVFLHSLAMSTVQLTYTIRGRIILMILTGIGHLQINCVSRGSISVVILPTTWLP